MPRPGIKRSASLYVHRGGGGGESKENEPPGGKTMEGSGKRLALGLNTSVLNLSINDCTCPICLEILIEPVQMPCHHEVCLPCFKAMTDKTNFLCPMCRMRISTWSRAASNSNTLVNQQRWAQIQKAFPNEIRDRVEGKTAVLLAQAMQKEKEEGATATVVSRPPAPVAEPGAIRREYEEYLRREQERLRAEKENEEKLSLDLIQRVLREEESVSMDDYMRLIQRNGTTSAAATANVVRPVVRANTVDTDAPPPPTVPPVPVQPPPPPPQVTVSVQLQRLRTRLANLDTPTTSSSDTETADSNNIKLRLRPSIKRTVRPVIATRRTEEHKDADSSLDSSTDTRTRYPSRRTAQLNESSDNEAPVAAPTDSTATLPKRRMSLRRASRL